MLKKIYIFLLIFGAAAVFASCSILSQNPKFRGFENEEEAIEYFVEKLNDEDIDGALQACAYDLMAKNLDYEKMADWLHIIQPIYRQNSSDYEIGQRVNRLGYEQTVLMQVSTIIFQLNADGEFEGVISGTMTDYDYLDDVINCFDQSVLKDLELVAIYEQDIADNKEVKDRMEDQADIFGADDKAYRTVIYKYDSRYYQGGFSLL